MGDIATKLTTIAKNQQKVYDAGHTDGYNECYPDAYDEGYGDGVKSEYDAFWDAYQQNGKRTNYNNAFYGAGWNDTTFKPKYDIVPTDRNNGGLFAYSSITDVKGILETQGVKLDLSSCDSEQMLTWSLVTRLPVIDFSASRGVSFYYSYKLKSVDKVILKNDGSQAFNFAGTGSLQDVVFEGVIGQNIDLRECPLSKASIESVVAALSNTTTATTVTFKRSAVNTAFETTTGAADGSASDEWLALVATKSNWTITLA